jgi:CheY-like chemotaxis protein
MTTDERARRVLLILETTEERERTREALRAAGWEVLTRDSPIGATVEIVRSRIDAVVVDVDFDVMSGDRFAELIRKNDRLDPVALVLVTSDSPHEALELANRVGADAGICRGRLELDIPDVLDGALQRRRRRASTAPPEPDGTTVLVLRSDRFAVPLIEGRQLIGRDTSCRFVLNHPSVSRQHAAVDVHGSHAKIEDLGSHNGTVVNDVRIDRARVLDVGDVIRLGQEELVLAVKTQINRETVEID